MTFKGAFQRKPFNDSMKAKEDLQLSVITGGTPHHTTPCHLCHSNTHPKWPRGSCREGQQSYPLWENKHTAHKANSTMGHPSWSYLFMSCNFLTKSLWPAAYRETELAIIREEGEAKVLRSILAPLCFEVSFMRNGNICCRELHVDPTITFTWAIDL